MTAYIVRRVLISIPLLIGVTLLTYIVINLAPGDPITAMMDPEEMSILSTAVIEMKRRDLGLDKPVILRYVIWLKELATGNLGYSFSEKRPVGAMIIERLPYTVILMGSAVVVAVTLGILSGVVSALRQYSRLDYSLTVGAFFMVSVPEFFFALIFMFIGAVILKWFPTFGMWTPGESTGFTLDLLHHMVLPVLALSMRSIAEYMRYTRASVLDALSADFITTARAKGLSERVVLWKHTFRNALIPLVTILGLHLPSLIGGALIIETIFVWPGVGWLGYNAILLLDYPLQMGVLLMAAVATLTANLLADLAYAWVDPRIRHS